MQEAARCHGTESSRCERKDGILARTEPELSEPRCWGLFKKANLIRLCCGMTWPRRLHWRLQRHAWEGFAPYMPSSHKAERQSFPSNIQHSTWAETLKTAFTVLQVFLYEAFWAKNPPWRGLKVLQDNKNDAEPRLPDTAARYSMILCIKRQKSGQLFSQPWWRLPLLSSRRQSWKREITNSSPSP